MKLNKRSQYGLLFVLYLSRAGMGTLSAASANLRLSKSFLTQVARALRQAGVIESSRGPGGGYSLVGHPTALDVLNALGVDKVVTKEDFIRYSGGPVEHRALAHYALNINSALNTVLKRKVSSVGAELVANEVALMNRLPIDGTVN